MATFALLSGYQFTIVPLENDMPVQLFRHVQLAEGAPAPVRDLVLEANHRIANSLAIIAGLARMQGSAICETRPMDGSDVRLMLEELSGRIETVGRLHRLLAGSSQDATVGLGQYLGEIAEATASALSLSRGTEVRIDAEAGCRVTAQVALPLGLIVGELVTNALKYAHPTGVAGVIRVSCRRKETRAIVIQVSDDGVGLPEGLDPRKCNHMGMRLVHSLADELGAEISFTDTALGLSVGIRVPDSSQ